MSSVSKEFGVPPDADHITIEFLFYEIDFWCSCDHMTVEICDTQVDLGKFTPGDRGYVEGEVDGITWSSNSLTGSNMMGFNGFNDQKHEMKMTLPKHCFASGLLHLAFNLTTTDLASGGVDNLNITAYGLCGTDYDFPDIMTGVPMQTVEPTASPSALPSEVPTTSPDGSTCTEARMVNFEDFEGFNDKTWIGAEVNDDYQLQFSHFLGRFGRDKNRASKTFDVPKDAKSLTVEFLFYEIDSWEFRDRLLFIVGSTRLDLQQFGLRDPINNPNNFYSISGKASGISWQRKSETNSSDFGFSPSAKDQKHRVSVSIPSRYYADTGKLKVGFYLETSHDIWSESGGVDNFKITAHGTECHSQSSDRVSSSDNKEVCAHFWGDPHLVTFDGLKYDCQGEGEFVLLSSLDSSFEIQGRFESAASSKRVAVTRSYVVNTGDEDVPTIQIVVPNNTTQGCSIDMFVDGVLRDIEVDGTDSDLVQVQVVGNAGARRIAIYYPGSGLHVTSLLSESETYGCYLSSSICLPDDYRTNETFVGLLGSPNGDRKDDWMTPQGSSVSIVQDKRFEPAYQYCTENWCIRNETESLFTYNLDQGFENYSNCDAAYNSDIEDAVADAPEELISICAGDITCIIDGVAGNVVDAENDLENEADLIGCKKLIFFDDLEDTPSDTWVQGLIDSRSVSLSNFLGPFGEGQIEASKEFVVPADASRLIIEFMFYEIGEWNEDSSFVVVVGDTTVDLKEFDSSLVKLEGLNDGIFWSRHRSKTSDAIMYGSNTVLVHKVVMNVPNKYFNSGALTIEFMYNMIHNIETESGGIDSFRISAYFTDCVDGQLGTATRPEVTVHAGAATTMWSDGMLTCADDNIWLECFGDPTTNANSYPRTAQVRFEESYDGYICTQGICDDCIGSITVNAVTKLEDGATLFDFSSDDFIFAGFGIEAGGGFSSVELAPPLNENIGIGNIAEENGVSHAEFCLIPMRGTRKLEAAVTELEKIAMMQNESTEPSSSSESCFSAFAYFSKEKSTCFHDLGFEDSSGWSNGLFEPSSIPYSFDIYDSVDNCEVGGGALLGTLTVAYDGHKAVVTYEANASMRLRETYTYVGKNFLPLDGSEETVNPKYFPITHMEESLSGDLIDTFEVSGFIYDSISVVAYATICVSGKEVESAISEHSVEEPKIAAQTVPESGLFPTASLKEGTSTSLSLEPDGVSCQSTFAFFNSEVSTCFSEMGHPGSWGWSNGLLASVKDPYTLNMYAHAEGCNLKAGKLVGTVSVTHTGSAVLVNFETSPDYWLKETNTYVGKNWLPAVNGKQTIHPSQYSVVHGGLDNESEDLVTISGLEQDEHVAVIAHATVCGSFVTTKAPATTATDGNTGLRGAGNAISPDQKWHSKLGSLAKLW